MKAEEHQAYDERKTDEKGKQRGSEGEHESEGELWAEKDAEMKEGGKGRARTW